MRQVKPVGLHCGSMVGGVTGEVLKNTLEM